MVSEEGLGYSSPHHDSLKGDMTTKTAAKCSHATATVIDTSIAQNA